MYEFTTKDFYEVHRSMVKQSETLELDLYEISTIYTDRHVIMQSMPLFQCFGHQFYMDTFFNEKTLEFFLNVSLN